MPSRKKAQGKARKAKTTTVATNVNTSSPCDHYGNERHWSKSDERVAKELPTEYLSQYSALDYNSLVCHKDVSLLVYHTYNKYHQCNDSQKDLIRRVLLASGTSACLRVASRRDLTRESYTIWEALPFVLIMLEIEARDKHNGARNVSIVSEIRRSLADIIHCPRETVRFFHKRSPCNCLEELYCKLKECTQRTSYCWHCRKVINIRKLSRCEGCNIAQFCSYDCAKAHWPKHKMSCKAVLSQLPNETKP